MDGERRLQMSNIEFNATAVSATVEDGACIAGLADDAVQPAQWVVLQRSLSPDDQERKLGLDSYDFEVSGSTAKRGSIERASLGQDDLLLELRPQSGLDVAKVLVRFALTPQLRQNLAEKLELIFHGTDAVLTISG
jgi:hypothetical protein